MINDATPSGGLSAWVDGQGVRVVCLATPLLRVLGSTFMRLVFIALLAGVRSCAQPAVDHHQHLLRSAVAPPEGFALSADDPLSDPDRVRAFAGDWGCVIRPIGAVGHLNPASGYGEWPDAKRLLDELRGMR